MDEGVVSKVGIKVVHVQELLVEADLDGDGNVNYEEFTAMIFKVRGPLQYILTAPFFP